MYRDTLFPEADQEEPIKPWRGIDIETLPHEIKKRLKPHWQNWIVADPECARYGRTGEDIRIFVIGRKGAREVQGLSDIEFAQERYVLRRLPPSKNRWSGGGAAPVAATVSEPDPFEQEIWQPPARRSNIGIRNPANHTTYTAGKAPLTGEGPYTLPVDGWQSYSEHILLEWERLDAAESGKPLKITAYGDAPGLPWKDKISGLQPGSYRINARNSQGDSAMVRIEIRPEAIRVAEILYQPLDNTFYLLSEEDYAAFLQEARQSDAVIVQLEQAHQSKNQARIDAAKARIDAKLKGLVNTGDESSLLTEVVGFRGKKFTYVRSHKIKNHWRSYKIDKDMQRRGLCGPDGKLDYKKLKKKFKEGSKGTFKWNLLDPHGGSLNEWAAHFNQNAETILLPKDDPQRHFDASAQAQILRYTYGASLTSNFEFSDKTFGIKLEGGGDFAIAEGKVSLNSYYPKAAGHPIAFDYTVQDNARGDAGQVKHYDLGSMRARLELTLYGFAGASCQASAGVYFAYKPGKGDKAGRMQIRGSTKGDEGFAGAGGEAFAGAKAGGKAAGSGEWQNPEKGKKWAALMTVGAEADFAAGAGAEAKWYVSYEKGKFRVRAKAELVWGLGGGGGFVFSVNVDTIGEFCMFIYHQLKNNDFDFVDLLAKEAFEYFDLLRSYVLLVGKPLEEVYETGIKAFDKVRAMGGEYLVDLKWAIVDALADLEDAKTRQHEAEALAKRILANPDLVLFQPPEGKGRLLRNLCYEYWFSFEETQEDAIIAVLKTIQTWHEYKEVMEHLTGDGSRIKSKPASGPDDTYELGEQILWEFLDGAQKEQYRYHRLRLFMERRNLLSKQPQLHAAAIRDNGILPA